MDSQILLSVIVPAYNVEQWLPRCLDSILAQTYKNIEILVIDDGSTDDTPAIVDRYAKENHQIIAIHQSNKGLIETRERGIKAASGDFIGFVDGDDEIIPEMYERLIDNALRYQAQISQCGIMYCFYDGRRKPIHGSGNLVIYDRMEGCTALLQGEGMEPSLCNKIYQASLLKDSCLDLSVINNEDMLRNIVLFNRAERSVMEDFCGYLYWRRQDSMSNNRRAVDIGRNLLRARKQILDYVPDELKGIARSNYAIGAINTYNALIGNPSKEAEKLRKKCKSILKNNLSDLSLSSGNSRIKAYTILYLPFLYDMAQKVNIKRRRKRIKKQAQQAQKMSASKEG